MRMDMSKWNPWNWFRHEQDGAARNVPVQQSTALTPAGSLTSLHQEVDRLFDNVFRSFGMPSLWSGAGGNLDSAFRPNLDIDVSDKEYSVSVEIPGVDEKDLVVELGPDRTLRISGEKKQERREQSRNAYRVERSYGSFERVLTLPEDVDDGAIKATFKNGVLDVRLPRKADAVSGRRRIAVQGQDVPALKRAA